MLKLDRSATKMTKESEEEGWIQVPSGIDHIMIFKLETEVLTTVTVIAPSFDADRQVIVVATSDVGPYSCMCTDKGIFIRGKHDSLINSLIKHTVKAVDL